MRNYINKLRVLSVALVLALLASILPAGIALAAPTISVYPQTGKINDSISVYGYGFTPLTTIGVYFSNQSAIVGSYIGTQVTIYSLVQTAYSNNVGEIDIHFAVPSLLNSGAYYSGTSYKTVTNGTYYIYVVQSSNYISTGATFTVTGVGDITLDNTAGPVGTEVKVTGYGFNSQETVTVKYDDTSVSLKSGSAVTTVNGDFTLTFLVPESSYGDHTIKVTGSSSSTEISKTFTVSPKVTIAPESGVAGNIIAVTGTGFSASTPYTISFADFLAVSGKSTDNKGNVKISFTAPARGTGIFDITVADDGGIVAGAKFTTMPTTATFNPTTGYTGQSISMSGSGFQAGKTVNITFDNENVAAVTADAAGKFTATFNVPVRAAGRYTIKATDGINVSGGFFTTTTNATITPVTSATTPGYVGTSVTITGIGFVQGKTVTVTYDTTQVTTTVTNADSSFTATFKAPASKGGNHNVTVTDGTTTKQFVFVMESEAPSAPVLLKPEAGVKADAETYFEWAPVADLSGITYTFQVASSENFAPGTILLEKTGLKNPTYTLTKEEKLKTVSRNNPYYWRVKATDGASNEGPWAKSVSFLIAGFALTPAVIYAALGVLAIVLALLGFWLGRRTANT